MKTKDIDALEDRGLNKAKSKPDRDDTEKLNS